MKYKKLVSLLALSTFALAACTTDEEPSPEPEIEDVEETDGADEVEDTDADTDEDAGQSPHDIIDSIGDDLGYTAGVELDFTSGSWTPEGRTFAPTADEEGNVADVSVTGTVAGADAVYVYVVEGGEVVEVLDAEGGTFEYTLPTPDADKEFQIGVSDEELWQVGDAADVEELVRYENIIVLAPAE